MATKKTTSRKSAPTPGIKVGVDKDSSVSVRQIENGYLVSESGTTGKGRNKQYYSKEFFSKTNPLRITGGGTSSGSGGGMRLGGKK